MTCPACGGTFLKPLYETDKPGTFNKVREVGWVCDECSYTNLVQESKVNWDLLWEGDE